MRRGETFAVLEAVTQRTRQEDQEPDEPANVRITVGTPDAQRPGRYASVNGSPPKRAAGLAGSFPAVVFDPGHLSLVKGAPEGRRRFLDAALCQLYPGYLATYRRYVRALQQKNALLRHSAGGTERPWAEKCALLEVLNVELAAQGEAIQKRRREYLALLTPLACANYAELSHGAERMAVRYALNASRAVEKIMPSCVGRFIEKRFRPVPEGPDNGASFDLIRASVNLTVAALLISLATSLRLPLSTTYVTFMVAMGSSLADKAWGRDSAVYRITGVITVISGWFFTAFAAFSMCFIVAACILYGGLFGIIAMCSLAAFLLLKSSRLHRKRTQAAAQAQAANYRDPAAAARYNEEIIELMKRMAEIYEMNLEALNVEDRKRLKKLRKEARGIRRSLSDKMAMEVMPVVRELPDKEADRGKRYVQMVEYATSVFESLSNITTASHAYIDNNHEGLDLERIELLRGMNSRVSSLYPRFREMMESNDYTGLDECLAGMDALDEEFAEAVKQQIILRPEDASDMRRALLYLNLLNETRTMIRKVLLLAKIQRKFVLGW